MLTKSLRKYLLIPLFPFFALYARAKGARKFTGSFRKTRQWYWIDMPGCTCSSGKKYFFYVKKGTENKLLVHFMGGGAAWDASSAAKPALSLFQALFSGGDFLYTAAVSRLLTFLDGGILEKDNPKNPFNDWNVIQIPYATADFHTGNGQISYYDKRKRKKVCRFQGEDNLTQILKKVKELFPEPQQLMIAGESAGGFGCVAQGDRVAAAFPGCDRITVISDGTQLRCPGWKTITQEVWKTRSELSDCIGADGLLIADWMKRLHRILGDHVQYLHINSPLDETLIPFQSCIQGYGYEVNEYSKKDYADGLRETVQTLMKSIPGYRCFITEFKVNEDQTTAHTALGHSERFYKKTEEGIALSEWIAAAVDGRQIQNVGLSLLK